MCATVDVFGHYTDVDFQSQISFLTQSASQVHLYGVFRLKLHELELSGKIAAMKLYCYLCRSVALQQCSYALHERIVLLKQSKKTLRLFVPLVFLLCLCLCYATMIERS